MSLEQGTLLHERYRIVEVLGQGGMGSVYRAVDENLGVDVAVKENLFTTEEYARQFRLEAVILANLRHPNLPRVTDHFAVDGQEQYLIMDYIDGEDLRQRMERVGTISEEEAILIGAAMCDALAYLHSRTPIILHRDVKPGNVKITPDGQIFLVDFGLAKVVKGSEATTTGARAMTPGYSPPEQYGTARTDPRTDIYSLAATLYAALTGIIPEDGLARAMDNTRLTPLRKRNTKLSRRLATVIEKALAVDPGDRYQNAEEFKLALLESTTLLQDLTGKYTVSPPPPESLEINEKSKEKKEELKTPKDEVDTERLSISGPPARTSVTPPPTSRKRYHIGCWLSLIILIVLAVGAVGIRYYYPRFYYDLSQQAFSWLALARSKPAPTGTPNSTSLAMLTPGSPTLTPTISQTPTLTATQKPTETPTLSATPIGGGLGQIAFASNRTGMPQIYLINVDGSGLHPITNLPNGACQPSWAPDGMRLVFISPCPGMQDVYKDSSLFIINADGTALTSLPSSSGGDFEPAWSPDGERIAFTSSRDNHLQIYLLNLRDNSETRLINTGFDIEARQPAWSPWGNQIAYTVIRYGAYQIWTMTDAGQSKTQLVRSGTELWDFLPTWSPDGQVILFDESRPLGNRLIWLMSIRYEDRETETATRLDIEPLPILQPRYSPDGLWLTFVGIDDEENRDIFLMTASGEDRTRLTSDPGFDFDPAWRPASP
jgi:serine/threonine protein kinase/Tol biopolymer transport system component